MNDQQGYPLTNNPFFDDLVADMENNEGYVVREHLSGARKLEYEYARLKFAFGQFITQNTNNKIWTERIFTTDLDEDIKLSLVSLQDKILKRHLIIMDKIKGWSDEENFGLAVRDTVEKILQMPKFRMQEEGEDGWLKDDPIGKLMAVVQDDMTHPYHDLASQVTQLNKETEVYPYLLLIKDIYDVFFFLRAQLLKSFRKEGCAFWSIGYLRSKSRIRRRTGWSRSRRRTRRMRRTRGMRKSCRRRTGRMRRRKRGCKIRRMIIMMRMMMMLKMKKRRTGKMWLRWQLWFLMMNLLGMLMRNMWGFSVLIVKLEIHFT